MDYICRCNGTKCIKSRCEVKDKGCPLSANCRFEVEEDVLEVSALMQTSTATDVAPVMHKK